MSSAQTLAHFDIQTATLIWHLSDALTVAETTARELKLQREIRRTGQYGKLPNDSSSVSHSKSDSLPFLPGNKLCKAEGMEIEDIHYLSKDIWQGSLWSAV